MEGLGSVQIVFPFLKTLPVLDRVPRRAICRESPEEAGSVIGDPRSLCEKFVLTIVHIGNALFACRACVRTAW